MYYPPYLATIGMFAGNFAVYGWQLCNGQLLAIPALRGRVPLHQGTGQGLSTYVLGQAAGSENVGLTQNNLPRHTHLVNAVSGTADKLTPTGNVLGAEP